MWSDVPCKLKTTDPDRVNQYASVKFRGRTRKAHIAAWVEANGEPPPETPCVLHYCDTPACYELEHLWLGTHQDNMVDMASKGRGSSQKKTHCPKGHEYTEENTRLYKGARNCRQCDRDRRLKVGRQPKTHCPQGHPYDAENTWVDPKTGWRQCRACGRLRWAARARTEGVDPMAGRSGG